MIKLIYLYPQWGFLGNEINISRIIDDKIEETIIIYGIDKKQFIEIYMTNTYTGENKLINKVYSIDEIELFIQKLQYEEDNIKNQNDLFSIEKYILKKFSI
jgi:hypothetical protein